MEKRYLGCIEKTLASAVEMADGNYEVTLWPTNPPEGWSPEIRFLETLPKCFAPLKECYCGEKSRDFKGDWRDVYKECCKECGVQAENCTN